MARRRTILIADDDSALRSTLVEQLALGDEFLPLPVSSAAELLASCIERSSDLAVIGAVLPDMAGPDAVRALRAKGFENPIIVLSDQTGPEPSASVLEMGANDVVGKPFKFAALLARIRAHLRQLEATEDAELVIGSYTFRPVSKQLVSQSGDKLRLTEKETEILKFLHRAQSQVVAREILLKEVWGYNAQVTTHTLETHIYRLRQKIEKDPANAELLVTEAGGYRLAPYR